MKADEYRGWTALPVQERITGLNKKMQEFTTRELTSEDWDAFRQIRLEALTLDADKFGCSLSVEQTYTEHDWRSWLQSDDRCMLGVFAANDLIGIAGSVTWHKDLIEIKESPAWPDDMARRSAFCIAAYIRRQYRRHGLSHRIFNARVNWLANRSGYRQALAAHRASNRIVRGIFPVHGFVHIETRPYEWPDGAHEDIMIYRLNLDELRGSKKASYR